MQSVPNLPYESMDSRTAVSLKEKKQLQEQYTQNWLWRTLASFVEMRGFNSSPIWIANRLSVTVEEVVVALEGLEKLGIIRRTESGYQRVMKFVYFSDQDLDAKSILADHVLISTQVLNRLDPENPKSGSFYRTGFVASNKQLVRQFCRNIESLMKTFIEDSARSHQQEVYAFSFSNVNMLETSSEDV